jgi:hypothetical protein
MLIVFALSNSHCCPRSEYAVIRKSASDAWMKIKSTIAPLLWLVIASFRAGAGISGFAQSLLGAAAPALRAVQQCADQVASGPPRTIRGEDS